jgi:hypothetical protein
MPDDWVHCLFTGSVIGADYEVRHCWVNQLLDFPAGFLGGHHRILLHDLETAKKLGTCCWWAGFVAALHIDIDNVPAKIRSHLENAVRPFKNFHSNLPKQTRVAVDKIGLNLKAQEDLTSYLRNTFLKVHEKVGIRIFVDDKTSREALIIIEPNTLLKVTWDYVNQFPLKGIYVDGHPYNELPPTEPRIILHPNSAEISRTPPHVGDCLDLDLLKYLFPS